MAAHNEFANEQNNPCLIGLGLVGASQPLHFDMVRHLLSRPSRAPHKSPVPLLHSFFAAVAVLMTTTARAAELEKMNQEHNDDPADDPGGGWQQQDTAVEAAHSGEEAGASLMGQRQLGQQHAAYRQICEDKAKQAGQPSCASQEQVGTIFVLESRSRGECVTPPRN